MAEWGRRERSVNVGSTIVQKDDTCTNNYISLVVAIFDKRVTNLLKLGMITVEMGISR